MSHKKVFGLTQEDQEINENQLALIKKDIIKIKKELTSEELRSLLITKKAPSQSTKLLQREKNEREVNQRFQKKRFEADIK
jgi:hypothetical protein